MHPIHKEKYAFSLLLTFFSLKGKELSEQGAPLLQGNSSAEMKMVVSVYSLASPWGKCSSDGALYFSLPREPQRHQFH